MSEAETLRAALAEIKRREVEERCRYYKPNAKVGNFISLLGNGEKLIYLILAAQFDDRAIGVESIE